MNLSAQAKAQAEHDIRQYLTAIGKKYINVSLKQLKMFYNNDN